MDQIQLRRWQNLLILSGTGIIVFGIWSVVKTVLLLFTEKNTVADLPNDMAFRIIYYGLVFFLLSLTLGFRLIIGLSARSEGYGKKKHVIYIGMAVILFLIDAASSIYYLASFLTGTDVDIFDFIVTMIIDITSIVTIGEMIAAAIMVKRLSKKAQGGRK